MKKISNIILYALIVIAIIVMGLFYFGGGTEQALDASNPDADTFYVPNYTSLAITLANIFLIVGAIAAVLVAIFKFVISPKQSMKSLIGIGLLVGVILIAYLMSDATPMKLAGQENLFTNAFDLKLADVCLYSSWILLILTIIAIVYANLMKVIR